MHSSGNVVYLPGNPSPDKWVSNQKLAPGSRAILQIHEAIKWIVEERESLQALATEGQTQLTEQRIEELIQSVRIRIDGLTAKEAELMIFLSKYVANKKNLVLCYDYENWGSIVVESIAHRNTDLSKIVKSATS